jgi:hypothetical protein
MIDRLIEDPASATTVRQLLLTFGIAFLASAYQPYDRLGLFAELMMFCAALDAAIGAVWREPIFDVSLNHWDKALAFLTAALGAKGLG